MYPLHCELWFWQLIVFYLTGDKCRKDRRWLSKGNHRHCVQFHSNCERQTNDKALGRHVKSEARITTLMWHISYWYLHVSICYLSQWLIDKTLIKIQNKHDIHKLYTTIFTYIYQSNIWTKGTKSFT